MTFPRLANGHHRRHVRRPGHRWFRGTEVAGWYPPKEEVKAKADAAGLKIVAQWFSSFIVRDGIDAVIPEFRATCEYLQFLGATRVVVSEQTGSVQGIRDICIFENKPVLKDEEWPVLAEGLDKLGEIAHEYGLDLVYHHHLGTVVQTKEETFKLLELTDPTKVSLLFDTGHAFVGDGDVLGLLHRRHRPHQARALQGRTPREDGRVQGSQALLPRLLPGRHVHRPLATAPSTSPSPTTSWSSTVTRAGS